jgi:hypothetical protein
MPAPKRMMRKKLRHDGLPPSKPQALLLAGLEKRPGTIETGRCLGYAWRDTAKFRPRCPELASKPRNAIFAATEGAKARRKPRNRARNRGPNSAGGRKERLVQAIKALAAKPNEETRKLDAVAGIGT